MELETAQNIKSQVGGIWLWSGVQLYPGLDAANALLDLLATQGAIIWGMEGLSTDGRHVVPGSIADFSDLEDEVRDPVELRRRTYDAARSVLSDWQDVEFVDITFEIAK
jgi:hypothetical protein